MRARADETRAADLRSASEELRVANERLSLSETRLGIANAAAGIGTWEADLRKRTFSCDDKCRAILGLTRADRVRYSQFLAAAHPDDVRQIRSVLRNALQSADADGGLSLDSEFRVVDPDGTVRWVWMIGRSVHIGAEGGPKPTTLVGAALDITARKRSEEALREEALLVQTVQHVGSALASELDLPALIQTVTDEATVLTGAQFGAFFYNAINEEGESYTLHALSGAPREAFAGFPMPRNTDAFASGSRGTAVVRSDDITTDPEYAWNAETPDMPEGHLPVRSYLAVPVVSRSGKLLGGLFFGHASRGVFTEQHEKLITGVAAWAALAIDNATLYEAERAARRDADLARLEAEKASLAKTEFLATMSHELRTPLNAIAGYVTLIEMEIRGPITDQQREDLKRIQRSQKHLLSLINDVLNFAKLEAGQVELDVSPVAVDELLTEIEELMLPQTIAKGLRFTHGQCDNPLRVLADREKLRQILLNLVTNAFKFTDAGEVSVSCSSEDSQVRIRVTDTGRGIAADRLASIFEPFVQINRHLTPASEQGVGLGLAISRELARAMHGDLTAESVEGRGSTFTVLMPRGKAA